MIELSAEEQIARADLLRYTEDGPLIRKINSNIYIASARAELGDVEGLIGPDFDPGDRGDDVDTIGGLVFALAGHVPVKGEVIGGVKNFEFEVLQADSRQVRRIKIRRLKQRTTRPAEIKAKVAPKPPATKAAAKAKPEKTPPSTPETKAAE